MNNRKTTMKRSLWIVYLVLYVLSIGFFIKDLATIEISGWKYGLDLLLLLIGVTPIIGLIFNKSIGPSVFWKLFFILIIFRVVIKVVGLVLYIFYALPGLDIDMEQAPALIDAAAPFIKIFALSTLFYFPMYYAAYKYMQFTKSAQT